MLNVILVLVIFPKLDDSLRHPKMDNWIIQNWMIDYDIHFWMTSIIHNWMINYDIHFWMTSIIQNWMLDSNIYFWMTGIIQNWMIIALQNHIHIWMITDGH